MFCIFHHQHALSCSDLHLYFPKKTYRGEILGHHNKSYSSPVACIYHPTLCNWT